MAYVIAQPCVDVLDRACVEVCPVACFYEAGDQLVIHPQECVDCDACKPVCPTAAIFPASEVPAEWQEYTQKNADWFTTHPNPIKALTVEEAKATGLASPEVSQKLLAGTLGGQAGAAVAEAPRPAAAHEAPKPAAAAAPKPAAPKPQAPAFPNAENYTRAKVLLAQLIEAQAQAGELTGEQVAAAMQMVEAVRKEIQAAFGKAEVTLSDLEKKSITWRQHEEVARALLRCAETPGPRQVKRRLLRRFAEYAVGFACTAGLTAGAATLAWESVQDWTFTPTGREALTAVLQPEGFAVGIAFGTMVAVLAPFAAFAAWRMVSLGRHVLALGGFDRAAALRTLEMKAARRRDAGKAA